MMRLRVMAAVLTIPTALATTAGCGDSERGIKPDDTATTEDTAGGDTAVGDTAGGDTTTTTTLPNACEGDGDCSSGHCRSGVCVVDPPTGATSAITDPNENVPTTDPPDLSCIDQTDAPVTQTTTTTLYGAVVRFGDGRKTENMKVDVLLAEGFDPSVCDGMSEDDARDCYFGEEIGTVVGSATSVLPEEPAVAPSCEEGHHEECDLGFQCVEDSSVVFICELQFGLYEIADVPLNTPLILRTQALSNQNRWHDTWTFNVILRDDQEVDGKVQYDATMVSDGQWLLTPNTVGLTAGITDGHGVVGGRVRDCRGDDRDSWPIGDVTIGLANPPIKTVFFNNLEDDTVPLIDRESTNILGRFAALDIAPGWNRIAGAARVGDTVVSVGSAPVYVFPNALTIVSWPGRQPFWRQN